jgi:hypothetical protein
MLYSASFLRASLPLQFCVPQESGLWTVSAMKVTVAIATTAQQPSVGLRQNFQLCFSFFTSDFSYLTEEHNLMQQHQYQWGGRTR